MTDRDQWPKPLHEEVAFIADDAALNPHERAVLRRAADLLRQPSEGREPDALWPMEWDKLYGDLTERLNAFERLLKRATPPSEEPERDTEWPNDLLDLRPGVHHRKTLRESYAILAETFRHVQEAHVAISRSGLNVLGMRINERVNLLIELARQ